MQACWFALLFA